MPTAPDSHPWSLGSLLTWQRGQAAPTRRVRWRRGPLAAARLFLLPCLLLLALDMPAASARSESRSKSEKSRSQGQFEAVLSQAQAAIDAKDFATAYQTLAQAYQSQPNSRLLLGLATLAAAEGKTVEAQDLLRRFLADPSLDAKSPERTAAQDRWQSLPLVPAGEVSVGAPRGALVQLDGRLVGVTPLPAALLVSTGRHRVSVQLGRWRAATEVNVRTARLSELRFKEGVEVAVATLPAAVLYIDSYQGLPSAAASSGAAPAPPAAAVEVEPRPAGEGPEPPPGPAPSPTTVEKGAGSGVAHLLLESLLDPLTVAAAAALKRENYVLLGRGLALAYAQDVPACRGTEAISDACLKALATRYGVDLALRAQVVREDRSVRIDVTLIDLQVEDVAATASASCPGCVSEQMSAKLAESITQALTTGGGRARGTLQVTSEPAGSEVRIGSRLLGVTPLNRKVWAGSYEVRVGHDGFKDFAQQIEVKSDETTPLQATLSKQEDSVRPEDSALQAERARQEQARSRRRLIMIGAGAAGIAVGAVLLGFGASALAANGGCAVPNPTDPMQCRKLYDTLAPGAALTAVGGALILGGGVTLIWPLVKKN